MDAKLIPVIKKNLEEILAMNQAMIQDEAFIRVIEAVAIRTHQSLSQGGKLMLVGNGGSAAEAQHIAAEFVNHFSFDRPALAAIALTTDSSVMTSIGNDRNFDQVFSRQIYALGKPGDILFAYSTSGESKNILEAIQAANSMNIFTAGFSANNSKHFIDLCDTVIQIPSDKTPHVQEGHLMVGHIISGIVEHLFFSKQ